jgi:hypothetical protein
MLLRISSVGSWRAALDLVNDGDGVLVVADTPESTVVRIRRLDAERCVATERSMTRRLIAVAHGGREA